MAAKPSLDVVLERLAQNTKLTLDVKHELQEGFRTLNGRVTRNTEDINELKWWRKYEEDFKQDAANEAKRVIEKAAEDARKLLEDNPKVGSNKWWLVTLVTIILALITALGATQ
jgi:hypothetical protein